ncbi:MAG: AAA family ATPase, partial [Rhizobiaceae bacterium]
MRETVLGQRFIFHRLNSLPRPPIRTEIVSGFAAAGEMIALVGPPGTGKSAIGVLLASSVAAGTPFLGRTVRRGTVVYVAAERRIEAERRLLAGGDSELPIYVSGARPALANADDVDDLINGLAAIESAAESPIRLVIFDTAAKCFRGLDENSARDVGMAVEGLTRIGEAVPTA